ncbi:putative nucleolar protein Nop56 [Babesia divergens]|uniref:Nucleolar protein 56 n=1 Tax=Babesia divergens TaxID=32595 RepID=A0AAD9GDJ5_BABDI|nr:putative nucleolar protein Nop56 [Babesia divergens]
MTKTFFLFETAAGYALYEIDQWEQIGHVDAMEDVCCSEERFRETVKFKAFQPFGTAAEALENISAVVEGEITQMLSAFLKLNLPRKDAELAVVDPVLGKNLSSKGIKVVYNANVLELMRGCRQHEMKNIAKLASGASAFEMNKFQVGLGHNFSRSKLQVDPRRHDKPVMNCVAILDSLTKNLNSFAMRVREWYGWHFPELIKIVNDNKLYCKIVTLIQHKDKFDWSNRMDELVALINNEEIATTVKKAANQSIGHELAEPCMQNILNFANQVIKLEDMRDHLNEHLSNKLKVTAPNLSTVAGNMLTGRLISHAGSLVNLAKMSASSIQILGAEKALFRALKTRSNTPKYGLIFQSNFIGKASLKHKGRAARYLANKCALAARLDCFCDINSDVYGKRMVELLGKRMEYLAGGPAHETSIEMMKAAAQEYNELKVKIAKEKRKIGAEEKSEMLEDKTTKEGEDAAAHKPKKSKKQKTQIDLDTEVATTESPQKTVSHLEKSSKKSKKNPQRESEQPEAAVEPLTDISTDSNAAKKSKKEKKSKQQEPDTTPKAKEDKPPKDKSKKKTKT